MVWWALWVRCTASMQWAGHQLAVLIYRQVRMPLHGTATVYVCDVPQLIFFLMGGCVVRERFSWVVHVTCGMCMWGCARQAGLLNVTCLHHQKGLRQQCWRGVAAVWMFVCCCLGCFECPARERRFSCVVIEYAGCWAGCISTV